MAKTLNKKSLDRLSGVHPDLVAVVKLAIELSDIDFQVIEGVRSKARQEQLFKAGASQTLNSRHLTGHAVDLAALVNDSIRWDWPLYFKIADAMKKAATQLKIKIVWGGDWRTFKDGPHFELSKEVYK
jgi:peptidoglycan L-alanyl-D-glutamate endopeptidase CwlK